MTRPDRFTMGIGPNEYGRRYWMNIAVYDTTADMRTAAVRHRPTLDHTGTAEAGAVFQAANSGHPTYLGIMRFSAEFLNVAAIVHESVHAALVYVQKTRDVARLHLDAWSDGQRIIDNEEGLAYSVHGISTSLLTHFGLTA